MSRTPIAPDLIHDLKKAEENAKKLDHLCEIFDAVARPTIAARLAREAQEMKDDQVIASDAFQEVTQLLQRKMNLVSEEDKKYLEKSLLEFKKSVGNSDALLNITEEEITETNREFSEVLASSWVDVLYFITKKNGPILLDKTLLPDRKDHEIMDAFETNMSRYPVSQTDLPGIMGAFAQALFNGRNTAELPLDMKIEKDAASGGYRVTPAKKTPAPL